MGVLIKDQEQLGRALDMAARNIRLLEVGADEDVDVGEVDITNRFLSMPALTAKAAPALPKGSAAIGLARPLINKLLKEGALYEANM